jgi:hypothetical protein
MCVQCQATKSIIAQIPRPTQLSHAFGGDSRPDTQVLHYQWFLAGFSRQDYPSTWCFWQTYRSRVGVLGTRLREIQRIPALLTAAKVWFQTGKTMVQGTLAGSQPPFLGSPVVEQMRTGGPERV